MFHGGFPGGFGFGAAGFGPFGGGFGGHGFGGGSGGPRWGGPGFGGHGFGRGQFAAAATAALLLDGPADAAEITRRVTEATDGAFTPPEGAAEVGIGLLAGRGVVTVDEGVATLTEFGENILAWRGINSDTAHAFLAQASKFAGVLKLRKEFFEVAGLARTIMWTGTDEQREKLEEARDTILAAVTDAKRSLYAALAQG
ncbi:hypothetical protein [Mycolicibacterium brisbanense]|uniref:PadR family transcriptional regulator n=1 Tax=Mycolicibacterium brisbanense TaxID=146020 RepID=A0A100VWP0_9MYCO|nr:hypothetical protein [Mycolicibacterium brisbanense]MCV7161639.1 hypothetical protein [Mycolicibacterium brisbanense]GAS87387.1 uncharacterized protein RMCB_1483 [Mycolicibacterium brisbanense]